MKAFHNDPAIKAKYLSRVQAHIAADEVIKGKYWENGKGCAVGCTVHSDSHAAYEKEMGIPQALARLEDGIFEGLPNDLAKTWPERFLSAITPGADLSQVSSKFLVWLLINKKHGVVKYAGTPEARKAIFAVAKAYKRQISGETVPRTEWVSLKSAAAASYASTASASAYASSAAASAYAYSAASASAASAASAYAYSASTASAYSASYSSTFALARAAQSEKLLKLLRQAA